MARRFIAALCLATLAAPQAFGALPSFDKKEDEDQRINVTFEGVDGSLLENVRALSSLHRLSASKELDSEMVGRLVQRAPAEARTALRPFGYYEPRVTTRVRGGRWPLACPGKDRAGNASDAGRTAGRDHGHRPRRAIHAPGPRAIAAAHGRTTEPCRLRPAEGRAAACGARPRISRRRCSRAASSSSTRQRTPPARM